MIGLFFILFVIVQITQQTILNDNNVINLISMKDVFDHINVLYSKELIARKNDLSVTNQLRVSSIKLINHLKDISQQLKYSVPQNNYESQFYENLILNNIEDNDKFLYVKTMMNKYINNVEYWYMESLNNVDIGSISENRMTNFVESVLESKYNLPKTLFDINKLIFSDDSISDGKDFFSLIMKDVNENYERFCGRTSSQQQVYYIIKQLIQTELEGFIAISQAYYFEFTSNPENHSIREYEINTRAIRMRLLKYLEVGSQFLKRFLSDVRECDIKNPRIGDNVLELELCQVIDKHEVDTKNNIHFSNCSIKNLTNMKISTEPQISDIVNNMIVVGVKFIKHDNAIHLQIKQCKISKNGFIEAESKWKPIDLDNNNKSTEINCNKFFKNPNILYLDNINIDSDYVVTGVKFQLTKDGKGFELHVHSTKYNYTTGQLEKEQKWFGPGDHAANNSDYQRERIEVNLNKTNDQSIIENNYFDLDSNKFIQFQQSSIKKNDEYHTIPFIDAQPVEVLPEFPLSGVGIFHKRDDRFGGYIALQLFTQKIDNALESSFYNWKKLYDSNDIVSSVKENESDSYPNDYSSQWHENKKIN